MFASFPTGFLQIFALFTPGLLGRYRHTSADFDQTQLYSPILQYCKKYGVFNACLVRLILGNVLENGDVVLVTVKKLYILEPRLDYIYK